MIKAEVIESIGVLTLARPEVHNAINMEMMNGIKEALTGWADHTEVKMILITGAGDRYFCSGGDIEEFHHLDGDAAANMLHYMKEVLYQLQTFPKPTVLALNGSALGGGCELATACDFRLGHQTIELGFIQIKLGITTGWGGATRLLSIVPESKALKLLLTGKRIGAEEALELGLLDAILPSERFIEHALQWCKSISIHSMGTLLSYKQTLLDHRDTELQIKEKIDREVARGVQLWGSSEHTEIVAKFLNRSKKK